MNWKFETYRRLYVRTDANWLAMPVSARGLGSELLRYCDDRGRLPLGGDAPGEAIARIVSAKRHEWDRVNADVADLLKDGYLVLDGDALVIRNFEVAQAKTPAAKRTESWRERKASQKASPSDALVASQKASPSDGSETPKERHTETGLVTSPPCLALPSQEEEKSARKVEPETVTADESQVPEVEASPAPDAPKATSKDRIVAELHRVRRLRGFGQVLDSAGKWAQMAEGQSGGRHEMWPHVRYAVDCLAMKLMDDDLSPGKSLAYINEIARQSWLKSESGDHLQATQAGAKSTQIDLLSQSVRY